jgi:hypothetical protein
MNDETERLVIRIRRALPNIRIGSLRFWGAWFGRPYDAFHRIVDSDGSERLLRVHFNEGETLSVWSPDGLIANTSTFRIRDAERVRWEWFYYGRPKTEPNRCFIDFAKSPDGIVLTSSDAAYYPDPYPKPSEPAVEITSALVKD